MLRRFLAQQHTLGLRARVDRAARGRDPHVLPVGGRRGAHRPRPSLLLGRPKVVNRLPTVLRPGEAAALAEAPADPAADADPLERSPCASRDRGGPRAALRLRPASGRGRQPSRWTGSTSTAAACSCIGKGSRSGGAHVGLRGGGAASLPARTVVRSMASETPPALFFNEAQNRFGQRDIRAMVEQYVGCSAAGAAGHPAHPAAFVRDASAGRRGRHPSCTGTAGHASVATTQRYTHVSRSRLFEAYERVPPEGLTWRRRRRPPPKRRARPGPTATGQDEDQGEGRRHDAPMTRRVVTIPPQVDDELGEHWHAFKSRRRRRGPREADPALRAAREVRGDPRGDRPAGQRRAGRPRVSYGMFGLIDALEKFEPGRGNKFETYAIPRIKGAIIDELRAMDWVPRSVRFKAARDREGARRPRGHAEAAAHREGDGRAPRHLAARAARRRHRRSRSSRCWRSTRWCRSGADRGEQVSLIDTLADKGLDPT